MTPLPARSDCYALLDDASDGNGSRSRLYTGFMQELRCEDPAQLAATWAQAEAAMRGGAHAVLLADYEWGVRLQGLPVPAEAPQALRIVLFSACARLSRSEVDAWLAMMDALAPAAAVAGMPAGSASGVHNVRRSVTPAQFDHAIARIQSALRAGDTYQINYTYRVDFEASGTPLALYRRLRARQPVPYGALIALPHDPDTPYILSLSPELFLRHAQGRLTARPMKGTARRTGQPDEDARTARTLASDPKNRAENLMIVDLLRNDLGRIATTGSVKVPALFSVEPYAGVFQMTSTVEAELPARTTLPELLHALFPCGSITGAPKHHTMELIAELETTPRGLYTGMIGWIDTPPANSAQACGDFCLSVAIRTVTLGHPAHGPLRPGRMGVGAGIVLDSVAADEYEECALKARFLTALETPAPHACTSPSGGPQAHSSVGATWPAGAAPDTHSHVLATGLVAGPASYGSLHDSYDMAARYDAVLH